MPERQSDIPHLGRVGSVPDLEHGTAVVLPSATFPVPELRKIKAIEHYEERMLFTALSLARPDVHVVYLTSLPVDEAIVEYYLGFLPDPAGARHRLTMTAVGEPGPDPLTIKLLRRPETVAMVREAVGEAGDAFVLPFNVSPAEEDLAGMIGLPLYGAPARLSWLGSKTGSRQVAGRAGVAVPAGREGLFSVADVERAIDEIRQLRPQAEAVVIKLDNGFSGQGNAIVELAGGTSPLVAAKTTFCAGEESWSSFALKIAEEGAIVEELLRQPGVVSPSVQLRITPSGTVDIVSTHDQILGGPEGHVYLGCRFPADAIYRREIEEAARRVAQVLAGEGVIGSFGIDFLVTAGASGPEVLLSEINLRMGGTTHPFWMAKLVTGAAYDADRGELVARGQPLAYVATDNLIAPSLVGRSPAEVIDTVCSAGLAYDTAIRRGVTLHMLGAVRGFGKMGATCIARDPAEAGDLYRQLLVALGAHV